jgi:hypothetical protein
LQWTAPIPAVQAMVPVLEGSATVKQDGKAPTAVLLISRCTSACPDVQNMAVMTLRLEHVSVIIIGLVQTVRKVCIECLMNSYRLM